MRCGSLVTSVIIENRCSCIRDGSGTEVRGQRVITDARGGVHRHDLFAESAGLHSCARVQGCGGLETRRATTKIRGPQALLRRCLGLLHCFLLRRVLRAGSDSTLRRAGVALHDRPRQEVPRATPMRMLLISFQPVMAYIKGSCHLVWWHKVGSCCVQLQGIVSSCLVA